MNSFFSFISDGKGNISFIKKETREKILQGKLDLNADSFSIIELQTLKNESEYGAYNYWNYNPITRKLVLYCKNTRNDEKQINRSSVMARIQENIHKLVIKNISNPFTNRKFEDEITPEILRIFEKWVNFASWADSSIPGKLQASMRNLIKKEIDNDVYDMVYNSVCDSVMDAVRKSISNSIFDLHHEAVMSMILKSI